MNYEDCPTPIGCRYADCFRDGVKLRTYIVEALDLRSTPLCRVQLATESTPQVQVGDTLVFDMPTVELEVVVALPPDRLSGYRTQKLTLSHK